MIKFRNLITEIEDTTTIYPKDIYNFFYLWHITTDEPNLIQTPYGHETLKYYIDQFKEKFLKVFKRLVYAQLKKYVSRQRIDTDYPVNKPDETSSAVEMHMLMKKTFRSDMRRRNTNWELISESTAVLEAFNDPKKIFIAISQLLNAVHNTETSVLGKLSNYYSSLKQALDAVSKTTNMEMLKNFVDKDLRDLHDQDLGDEPVMTKELKGDYPVRVHWEDPEEELRAAIKSPFTAWNYALQYNKPHPLIAKALLGSPFEKLYRQKFGS